MRVDRPMSMHRSIQGLSRSPCFLLFAHHTKDSYPDLARAFGGKHHTTVISAVQKIIELRVDIRRSMTPSPDLWTRVGCKVSDAP
jgi:hypothetical protein